jgi:rRNA small subunit pseudouridine methyltransferase Nep1
MNSNFKQNILTPLSVHEKDSNRRLIIILDDCPLEAAKINNSYELLNSDDHYKFLLNNKKKPDEYRPDVVHQCLLTLIDSPVNKSGNLEIYLRTKKNILIQVNPKVRLPRTYQRFAGLMIQLLHKLKIRASDGNAILMKIIKNPITQYLPVIPYSY